MNKLLKYALGLMIAGLSACENQPETPTLEVSENALEFGKEAGSRLLTVKTGGKFIVKTTQPWCTPEKIDDAETDNLRISVTGFDEIGTRVAEVTVVTLDRSATITVTQISNLQPALSVAEAAAGVRIEDELEFSLEIDANIPIAFELPDWISEKAGNPAADGKTYTFRFTALSDKGERTGAITVKAADPAYALSATVSVTQVRTVPYVPPPTSIEVSHDVEVFASSNAADNGDLVRGSATTLNSYYNDGAASRQMIFLQFDLSGLAAVAVEEIDRITLKLYAQTVGSGGGNSTPTTHTLQVFNMTATNPTFTWTETSLTYNGWLGNGVLTDPGNSGASNAYAFKRNPDITTVYNGGNPDYRIAELSNVGTDQSGTWLEWDVTSAIVSYLENGVISLQICDQYPVRLTGTTSKSMVTFHSKENTSENIPYLDIAYK
ncbi:MAG: DNRLRE domain-containing protein [Bacteroidales bacterium]|jgi:hypothetical protein|nr:DNRLRE domain-containing protein [Bacteroidales bacterium]